MAADWYYFPVSNYDVIVQGATTPTELELVTLQEPDSRNIGVAQDFVVCLSPTWKVWRVITVVQVPISGNVYATKPM